MVQSSRSRTLDDSLKQYYLNLACWYVICRNNELGYVEMTSSSTRTQLFVLSP